MGAERPGSAYPRSAGLRLGGVARRLRGWAGAPGCRCPRRRHSAAMERPGGAADSLSRWPQGLGRLLFLLQLLPPATLGQDRLDAPPPPAAPLSRWSGPVGVSWGLRAAAPGGPAPRGGRWRRSAPGEDEDCGGVQDFVSRLANNTHQVRGRQVRPPPGLRGTDPRTPRGPPARPAQPAALSLSARLASPRKRPRPRGARAHPAAAPKLRLQEGRVGPRERPSVVAAQEAAVFRHRGGRLRLSQHSFFFFLPKLSKSIERCCFPSV